MCSQPNAILVLSQFSFYIGAVPITSKPCQCGLIATIFKPREAVSANATITTTHLSPSGAVVAGHRIPIIPLNPTKLLVTFCSASLSLSLSLSLFSPSLSSCPSPPLSLSASRIISNYKNSSFRDYLLVNISRAYHPIYHGIIGLKHLRESDFLKLLCYPIHSTDLLQCLDSYYQLLVCCALISSLLLC